MADQRKLRGRRHAAHRGGQRRVRAASPRASIPLPPKTEYELKLIVPEPSWADVVAALQHPDARELRLHAIYLDTADRRLAAARVGARLRLEGDRWVQTVKAEGRGALERLEDEVPLDTLPNEGPPTADLARHADPAVQAVLRSALALGEADAFPSLEPVFQVRVRRRLRQVSHGTSLVELALDEGVIEAQGRQRPVRELELELVQGRPADLLALARRWRERHALSLGWASKAERGHRLALGHGFAAPHALGTIHWREGGSVGELTSAVLGACLAQVAGNAAEISSGSVDDDHVHQLRVGLRRLRTALRELPLPEAERGKFEPALVRVFRALGERRDRTHVLRTVQPRIEAAGGPVLQVPPGFHEGPPPAQAVGDAEFQDALLALLALADGQRLVDGRGVRRSVRPSLDRLAKAVLRDGRRFDRLDEARQHRVRKRLKRLRYLGEFVAPLFPQRRVHEYIARLKPVQEALGAYNDEIMAQGLYGELARTDSGAAFGAQWLASRRRLLALECRRALRKLRDAKPFWEK